MPIYRLIPLFWLTVSVLLYVAGVHAQPLLARLRWRIAARGRRGRPALLLAAEALYYLGLPYVALLRGAVLPRYLGVSDLDWVQDVGLGVALMAGGLALASLAFRAGRFREEEDQAPATEGRGGNDLSERRPGAIEHLWGAIALQVHWAFYRATLIQASDDVYWGTFASLIPLAIEKLMEPALRRRLRAGYGGFRQISRLTLLATTTTISLFVRNLPLLIGFHWLAEMTLAAVGYSPGRQTARPLDSDQ